MHKYWKGFGQSNIGTFVLAIIAGLTPAILALEISKHVCITSQSSKLESVATELARRTDETGKQFRKARTDLNSGKYGAPGSDSEIAHMRALSLTSTYIQAVGRMDRNQITCTSMGRLQEPFDLGKPGIVTTNGVKIWLNIKPMFGGGAVFHALELDDCVIFIAPDLILDVSPDLPNVSMAIIAGADQKVISHRGPFDASVMQVFKVNSRASVTDGKNTITAKRCETEDLVAVVVQPLPDVLAGVSSSTPYTIPFGVFIGLFMAWLVIKIARRQQTLPYILKAAVANEEFFLDFQPIVDLSTRRVVGAEALIRWRRITGELIRPDLFIPVAEEVGLMGKITELVIDQVFAAARRVHTQYPDFYIGMNVSSTDLRDGGVADKLYRASEKHGVSIKKLGVEITESGLLDFESVSTELEAIRSTGVKLLLDDFGTGYSSLAYLMKLDVDSLKIDRLFVDAIGTEAANACVIDHIIDMAKELDKEVVAEGIETEEQANYLVERNVKLGQGYFFGRPMSLNSLITIMEEQQVPVPKRIRSRLIVHSVRPAA